jgi:hypothetical protein
MTERVLPDHLVGLPGGAWALWRWVCLRSAGFPAQDVLALASPPAAAAADALLGLEDRLRDIRASALSEARRAREVALSRGDAALAESLLKISRRLKAERIPEVAGILAVGTALAGLRDVAAQVAEARRRFDTLFNIARDQASQKLRSTAADARFREAITWQNHPLLETCVAPLLRNPDARSSKHRQHEDLIASYLHRYCLKNETIGFFGPVGWAQLAERGPALEAEPGAGLLRKRQVYFEQWAVDALARSFSEEPALARWRTPRPSPVARLHGTTARMPFRKPVVLTPEELYVFAACDGVRSVHQLHAQLALAPGRQDEILRKLAKEHLVSLDFDLPLDLHPERRLKERLLRIGDPVVRNNALARLAKFVAARDAVAAAAGDPDRLLSELFRLDADFAALTGSRPSRSAGQMYAGRTLIYEDCQRDVAVRIGPRVLEALGPSLTLVLTSARWLTWQVGQYCRTAFLELFDRLARGSPSVGFVEFYNHALNRLSKDTALMEFSTELRRRWANVLSLPQGAHSVRYASADLAAPVAKAFAAPGPGWPGACYHSPDLMIAGPSIAAINAGDFHFVLGELHAGANTLRGQFLVEQHPRADEIFQGVEADLRDIRLAPITPKRYATRATRIYPALKSERQYFAATTLDSIPHHGAKTLNGTSLAVRKADGELMITCRERGLAFDLMQSFAAIFARIVIDGFAITEPVGHTPRIAIDDLVVARETWNFARTEIAFARVARRDERFLAARRWGAAHRMPRWLFVRIPGEGKPLYLDFDSPITVDQIARKIRNQPASPAGGHIAFVEMLPAHGQQWLPDADHRLYSCELRMVAVDQADTVCSVRQPKGDRKSRGPLGQDRSVTLDTARRA